MIPTYSRRRRSSFCWPTRSISYDPGSTAGRMTASACKPLHECTAMIVTAPTASASESSRSRSAPPSSASSPAASHPVISASASVRSSAPRSSSSAVRTAEIARPSGPGGECPLASREATRSLRVAASSIISAARFRRVVGAQFRTIAVAAAALSPGSSMSRSRAWANLHSVASSGARAVRFSNAIPSSSSASANGLARERFGTAISIRVLGSSLRSPSASRQRQ